MSRSSYKSCRDGAGTANKCQESEAQRHGWETRRRNRRPGRASRCGKRCGAAAPFERALLGFAAQSLKLRRYAKAAAAIQNAIHGEKKSPAAQTSPSCLLQDGGWSWTHVHVRREWNRSSPSVRRGWRSSACSLQAGPCMPAAIMGHGASQDPRLFSLLLFFFNIAFMWQLYTTVNCYSSTKLALSIACPG